YTKKFKQLRSELSEKLFNLYNEKVFFNKLVPSCPLKWNKRLLKTAGYCCQSRKGNLRSFRIELSCKVCDDAERLRDTLIHEMCHAMVWMQYGERGHGAKWQLWARKSNLTLKDLPPITRCHSYKITTKFTYQCVRCSYKVGRHSRSLNTDKQVCPYCYGTFQLVTNQKNSSDPDKGIIIIMVLLFFFFFLLLL
ncbi:hypothetical protein HELRODRAFT_68915, partial [Helobdella robusta]|uniref:SprT-like domain-containing protein n=1 Tax=Helobdella robusta TaxID=6412 RepID=T1FZL1_HELRO